MWAICNNCNYGTAAKPCIIWVPGDVLSGETGCPYHIHGEDNDCTEPACWVAVPRDRIEEFISACGDDVPLRHLPEEDEKERTKLVNAALHAAKGDAE